MPIVGFAVQLFVDKSNIKYFRTFIIEPIYLSDLISGCSWKFSVKVQQLIISGQFDTSLEVSNFCGRKPHLKPFILKFK